MLPLLLLLGGAAASRWEALPNEAFVKADGKSLVFVSAIWRHGDRSPTGKMPGDHQSESDWQFGGGGYGQLSPLGMEQHFVLGRTLRARYVTNATFLSKKYSAKEIYVRATDVNRTLVSGMCNLAGMYSGTNDNTAGVDLPNVAGWPTGYVPIPIHTEIRGEDFVGNPDASCARQQQLWEMAHYTEEYKNYAGSGYVQNTLAYLNNHTNGSTTLDNIWVVWDGMLIETQHFGANSTAAWYPWYFTNDIPTRVDLINDKVDDFQNGVFESGIVAGLDLKIEIPKIRGGSLINEVLKNAEGVLACYEDTNGLANNSRCSSNDEFLRGLKYHAISAHDTTVAAYLTVLGAKTHVITPGGYPHYASTVLTEFYWDNAAAKPVFKVLFYLGDVNTTIHEPFKVITEFVEGCKLGEEYCDLQVYKNLATKFNPGDIHALCATPPQGYSPPPSTSSTATPFTGTTSTTTPFTGSPPSTTTKSSSLLSSLPGAVLLLLISRLL